MEPTMSSLATAAGAFGIVCAAAGLGLLLRRLLPAHHLGADAREVLKLVLDVVATMSALVLGLLVASAKASYDTQQAELFDVTAKMVELDRVLAHYGGPRASQAQLLLRLAAEAELERVGPALARGDASALLPTGSARGGVEVFYDSVQALAPETDAQRLAQARALQISGSIAETRHLMAQQLGSPLPLPFLAVLVVWLAILFGGFGLFAPPNATVVAGLLLGALSVVGAIFLILELARPYDGIMRISHEPLRAALSRLGQ
jgi:hypothetical protein